MIEYLPYLVGMTCLLCAGLFIITNIRLDNAEKRLKEIEKRLGIGDPGEHDFVGENVVPMREKHYD